ncbi:MAG: hypothetical protein NVSMB52_05730 [Chloroflexota bacterium]
MGHYRGEVQTSAFLNGGKIDLALSLTVASGQAKPGFHGGPVTTKSVGKAHQFSKRVVAAYMVPPGCDVIALLFSNDMCKRLHLAIDRLKFSVLRETVLCRLLFVGEMCSLTKEEPSAWCRERRSRVVSANGRATCTTRTSPLTQRTAGVTTTTLRHQRDSGGRCDPVDNASTLEVGKDRGEADGTTPFAAPVH